MHLKRNLKKVIVIVGLIMANTAPKALEIVTIEQPQYQKVLKGKAQSVNFPLKDKEINLIASMKEKLHKLGGVGLAAPQINISKQIIALYIPPEAALLRDNVIPYPMHIMINPSYEPLGSETIDDFEACYSVENTAGKVARYKTIKLEYDDENGKHHSSTEKDFYARVIQHEIDHLNGFLITDRLGPGSIKGTMEEIMALRRAELSPEKRRLFDEIIAKKTKK